MGFEFCHTNDDTLNFVHALVHGDSGIGKTTSLGTLPVESTLIVSAERGTIPLRGRNFKAVKVTDWQGLQDLCTKHLLKDEIKGKDNVVIQTVAFDSLTEFGEMCIEHIIEVDRPKVLQERSGGKKETPEKSYADQMQREDWGIYFNRMKDFIANVTRNIPANVIFTSLSNWNENERTGEIKYGPMLNGKMAFRCMAYFDLVFHMENVQQGEVSKRLWRTESTAQIMAKGMSEVLNEHEEPNWPAIFNKIKGEVTA